MKNKAIFIIVNVNVATINNICINKIKSYVYTKYNFNRIKNLKNLKFYFSKCFYYYNEVSLFFYVLCLKIDIFVIILRNIAFFFMCNNIRARILKINLNVLKTKIIVEKNVNIKVFISRISLNSKNNDVNKNRKKLIFVFFTKKQYFVRFVFVIIINKFQNQSLRYVDIDIKIRECFNYN